MSQPNMKKAGRREVNEKIPNSRTKDIQRENFVTMPGSV